MTLSAGRMLSAVLREAGVQPGRLGVRLSSMNGESVVDVGRNAIVKSASQQR